MLIKIEYWLLHNHWEYDVNNCLSKLDNREQTYDFFSFIFLQELFFLLFCILVQILTKSLETK